MKRFKTSLTIRALIIPRKIYNTRFLTDFDVIERVDIYPRQPHSLQRNILKKVA
jgi:hypothetical protein